MNRGARRFRHRFQREDPNMTLAASDTSAGLRPGMTHDCDLELRWGDLDALNHLNNTIYFRLMEEARIRMLRQCGLEIPAERVAILAHASCDFIRSLTYPSTVRVRHALTRVGRSSMDFEMTIARLGDAEEVYAKGRNVLVWSNTATGKSEPWPADVLDRLARIMRG